MAETGKPLASLRSSRFENERLALALVLSLTAHLLVWGGYELNRQFHFPWPHFLATKIVAQPQIQNQEPPLEFVMVQQPATAPPKNTKYYSNQNSRAANPDAKQEKEIPQINGKQTDYAKTESATKPDFSKLQPSAPPSKPAEPQPKSEPGDLTLAARENPKPRPRTINQALAEQNRLPGVQMRQNGGVHRLALVPSLDAKATPFGAYDAAFIEAVQQRWYDLLDSQQFSLDRTGKVTLRFDGETTNFSSFADQAHTPYAIP